MALPYVTERQITELLDRLKHSGDDCSCLDNLISDKIYFDSDISAKNYDSYLDGFILPFQLDTSIELYDGTIIVKSETF